MSDETWDIHVSKINGKTRIIHVSPTASADLLFEKVAKLISDDIDPHDVRLVFSAQNLEYQSGKTLKDYNILDGSTIVPMFRLPGGVWPTEALKAKKYNLQPLLGYITVTCSEDDPDMITFENDPSERRAKMPCGHVISPSSMTSYCHSLLSEGMYQFKCPQCRQDWPYFLIRHVACLSGKEMREFEEKLSQNYLAKASGIIECPGCNNYCYRDDQTTRRLRCLICSNKGKAFDFCWCCMNEWKNWSQTTKCGNADCTGVDKRIQLLASCPITDIRGIKVPSWRGCEKCGAMIEHKGGCKHMTCLCKHAFCFACLKPLGLNGKWACSAYGNECAIAPRQTNLPGC